jgi:hypothetical protein
MRNALDSISAEAICNMSFEILRTALLYHSKGGRAYGDWLQHVETPKHQIPFLGRDILVDVRDVDYSFTYDEIRGLYVRTTVAAEFFEDDKGAISVEIENIDSGNLQWINGSIYGVSDLVESFNKTE